TLKVYLFMVKQNRPVGVREVQRTLNLSSPSLAAYHLSKLEEVGLLRREGGNYVVNKVILENMVRIRRMLIPRYFFYSLFSVLALITELLFLRPPKITSWYLFSVLVNLVLSAAFCYETVKVWSRGGL
ncbi:ArsR family transcriptional regulator, partial [Candidatus Bathyarchaeota archaeon]|nr:ArsR family transcriptional regulator [Candidatus Bathyarchaeota archaeon]